MDVPEREAQEGTVIDSLVHFGQGFTADPVTTFPVCLFLGKIYRTTSQRTLLEDPPPITHVTIEDIVVEMVDVLANVDWRFVSPVHDSNICSVLAWP